MVSNISFAQRNLKYENVVKKATELSKEEAFGEYSDFLSLNPFVERANLYYQLAELASSIMKDLEPLKDYKQIKNLYSVSGSYYLICEQYINDNEVRKDQAFFTAIPATQRKLSAQDIILYIKMKRDSDSAFFAETTATFKSYTSMIDLYYRCMDIYKNICENNRNINDLYVNWDDNKHLVASLVNKFDSVVYLKNSLNEKLPNLNFSYLSINNFKIDGFSPANFKIIAELWDYKSWATYHQKYYDETVSQIVEKSLLVEKNLHEHINNINMSKTPVPAVNYADKNLMEQLRNLQGITSLYLDIEQKYRIIDFLNLAYDKRNKPAAETYYIDNQSAYIYSLTKSYNKIVALAKEMETNYPSMKKNTPEPELVSDLYNRSIENYKQYIINSGIADNDEGFTYNKTKIPKLKNNGFYRPSRSGYIVKSILKNDDGNVFLGGATVNAQGFSVAFTALSSDGQNINWLKTTDISKLIYDDCSMSICNIPAGVMSIVSSKNVSDPTLTTQTIVKYDLKGVEKQKITLPEKNLSLGRHILYDEISETTLLAFYGNTEEWFRDSVLTLQQLNKDNQQKFRSDIKLSGELISIFPSSNGRFIFFGNYVEFEAMNKKENTNLGIFSMIIDSDGKVIKTSVYPSDNPRYGITINRVSSDVFLISGTSGSIRKNNAELSPTEGEPVVILTTGNGELIYDYRKN
ncbi:MAG: hypothetical protein LBT50_09290 [Prevotellaceae bacterium]|jgi:hypothetical protein|nr:hypothetical protein [Prevotellaceae bacterium]